VIVAIGNGDALADAEALEEVPRLSLAAELGVLDGAVVGFGVDVGIALEESVAVGDGVALAPSSRGVAIETMPRPHALRGSRSQSVPCAKGMTCRISRLRMLAGVSPSPMKVAIAALTCAAATDVPWVRV
jgi:hypothetical protein